MSNLDDLKDDTAKRAFGMTKLEALRKGLCIHCKEQPKFYSEMGRREYRISGLCEFCFDVITDPDTCAFCSKPQSFHTHHANRGECEDFKPRPSEHIGD